MQEHLEQFWLFEPGLAFGENVAFVFYVGQIGHQTDLITEPAKGEKQI